jgi:ssDNA-binding Zn-finger/Zn-ribbon topoisomerase 1
MTLKKVRGIEMYQCPHCGKTLMLNESKAGSFKEENTFEEM